MQARSILRAFFEICFVQMPKGSGYYGCYVYKKDKYA